MWPGHSQHIAFIVDTDEYAGNFERELTAFCTGVIGDCGVGEEHAEAFKRECPEMVKALEEIVTTVPDDHGCARPASIWPTPGFWNDGMGTHWPDSMWGSAEAHTTYRDSVRKYKEEHKDALPHIDEEAALPSRHPAYQSVAMFLADRPGNELLEFLMRRARAYRPIRKFDGTFNVLGFRLIQTRTVEDNLWSHR